MPLPQWQFQNKFRALSHLAGHADAAMVQFHQFFDQRQPDAAAPGIFGLSVAGLVEAVEDMGQVGSGDAGTGVFDSYQ